MDKLLTPGRAIPTVDQVIAAVTMAHDVVQLESDTNEKLGNAWLVLQLAAEKLQELRVELERADMAECGSKDGTHG
jgi:hypothetical protein